MGCACTGNAGNVSPRHRFQRKPLVSDPGMHHARAVMHVGIAYPQWRRKRSRRIGNPQFYVSGKRPMARLRSCGKAWSKAATVQFTEAFMRRLASMRYSQHKISVYIFRSLYLLSFQDTNKIMPWLLILLYRPFQLMFSRKNIKQLVPHFTNGGT